MKTLLLFLLSISLSFLCQSQIIKTDKGRVEGYRADGIQVFKAIPFAAPPVGNLRWKAPQPAQAWNGVLACKAFSASPMQRKPEPFSCWTEEFIAPPSPLSEDCLYLNIWTKTTTKKKPVVVWIYGGGLNSGSAACAIYDGTTYAKNDVVFVGINYRVNIFGFFAHPTLTAESNGKGACNFGLLDQLEALKWVNKNIAAFGGDPNNVTIMGQSAGSFSVHALVASPLAKGLFHKAIGQSGGILGNNRGVLLKEAEANGEKLLSQLEAKSINELRNLSAEELHAKILKFNPPYSPVLDGYFLPTDLKQHYANKKHNDVPTLTGWVTGDGAIGSTIKISKETYVENIQKQFKEKSTEMLKYFPGHTDEEARASESKRRRLQFGGLSAILWAQYNSKPSFVYEFDHVPVEKPNFPDYGAFHTADVPFALGTLYTWNRPWREVDLKMEKTMSNYWVNFIKTGNPNGKGQAIWPKYDTNNEAIMRLISEPKAENGLYNKELALLKN
jgi:para-nitrobenzyl esterase